MNYINTKEAFDTRQNQHHTLEFINILDSADKKIKILTKSTRKSICTTGSETRTNLLKPFKKKDLVRSATKAFEILYALPVPSSKDSKSDIVIYLNDNKELRYLGRSWLANSLYHSAGAFSIEVLPPNLRINI
ncbi:MAG: hypothetical protein MRY57_03220 [Candidatus Pacebacteria bacterium]|nr:hypothetical protein [Candidatus Paceibacterota bacterium]